MRSCVAAYVGHIFRAGTLVLAGLTFLVGLISPLTPSEGQPGPAEVLLFVGTPLGLALAVALSSRGPAWRAVGFGLAILIAGITTWLFTSVL